MSKNCKKCFKRRSCAPKFPCCPIENCPVGTVTLSSSTITTAGGTITATGINLCATESVSLRIGTANPLFIPFTRNTTFNPFAFQTFGCRSKCFPKVTKCGPCAGNIPGTTSTLTLIIPSGLTAGSGVLTFNSRSCAPLTAALTVTST